MKFANGIVTFLYELVMLVVVFLFVLDPLDNLISSAAVGIVIDLALVVVWVFFLAPRAKQRLKITAGLIVSTLLLAIGPTLLCVDSLNPLSLSALAVLIVNRVLAVVWRQW